MIVQSRSELEDYLSERRVIIDASEYWISNKARFPILYQMAKDYLVLQPNSKEAEGVFSMARRYLPYYRLAQDAETITLEMLVNSGVKLGLF